jgi:Skp family chaperone for outer membrane proteins
MIMKNVVKLLTVGVLAFATGVSINSYATANVGGFKVATVDVQRVVASSKQVNALRAERQKQIEGLEAFVKKAREDVAKETNERRRATLEEQRNKELNDRKNKIDQDYAKKLADIDTSITKVINDQAKKDGFDLVLAKGVVLSGGVDITDAIARAVR